MMMGSDSFLHLLKNIYFLTPEVLFLINVIYFFSKLKAALRGLLIYTYASTLKGCF